MPEPAYQTFISTLHPGGRTKAAIVGTALAKPVGICMLPVMMGALVGMLQGYPVLGFLYFGFPISLLVASGWSWIQVRNIICEVHIHDGVVAIRSQWEAADLPSALNWRRLIDSSEIESGLRITLGLEEYSLHRQEWDRWSALSSIVGALPYGSNTDSQYSPDL